MAQKRQRIGAGAEGRRLKGNSDKLDSGDKSWSRDDHDLDQALEVCTQLPVHDLRALVAYPGQLTTYAWFIDIFGFTSSCFAYLLS